MEALNETQLYCPFAYIDGSWVAADSGEQITVLNPQLARRLAIFLVWVKPRQSAQLMQPMLRYRHGER